jgi:hypothetical protein
MFFFVLLFAIPVGIALAASYFIYILVRNRLIKAGNPRPKIVGLIVSVISFIIISCTIFYAIIANLNFTR